MPRSEPVYHRNVSVDNDGWDTSLVFIGWKHDDAEITSPERVELMRIPVDEIPTFLTYVVNHAMQALDDAARRISVGHCETCANTGLINITKNGRPWNEDCPDCADRRRQAGFVDTPRIGYRDKGKESSE